MGGFKHFCMAGLLLILAILAVSVWHAPAVSASSQAVYVIDRLPYIINTSGTYVINSDLYGPDGIVVNASDVTIIGNNYKIVATAANAIGVKIERYTYEVYNVKIENLIIEDFDYGIYLNEPGSYNWSGVVIDGVVIRNATVGIYNYECWYDLLIQNVVIEATQRTEYGIYNEDPYGVVIYNVTLIAPTSTTTTSTAIYSYDGYSTYIRKCRILGGWDYGIYDDDMECDCIAGGTEIINASTGIYLDYCEYTSIINTRIVNTSDVGLHVYDSYYVGILGTEVVGCGSGIYIEYSSDIAIDGCVVSNCAGPGIYLDPYSYDVNITSNQIIRNGGYGIEVHSTSTYVNVRGNVLAANAQTPQAYDENGVGEWSGNYWSDWSGSGSYVFTDNGDDSPLPEPLPDLSCRAVYTPESVVGGGIAQVIVEVENKGYANVTDQPLRLYWSEPANFTQAPFTWLDLDASSATEVDEGDVLEDYGNYTIYGDDEYFIYKLPFAFEIFGLKYNYISVSTNGLIEFLNGTESNVENEYSVHTYGYHRVMYYSYSPAGATTLFAYSGDLDAIYFSGVFNLGDKAVVWFNGSTCSDSDPSYPVQYQIILYSNGTVIVSLGNLTYTDLDGDGFTGLYISNLGVEIAAGYMLPPMTSWRITPKLNLADEVSINLRSGEVKNFTLSWNTGNLPHYSPFTLWGDPDASGDTSPYNDLVYSGVYVNPPPANPPPAILVGGELDVPNGYEGDATAYYVLATLALAAATVIVTRKK